MRVSFELREKHFLLLVGLLAVVSAIGIVTGYGGTEPSVMGHTPGEITGGTFGTGNYVFPGNLNVNSNLGVQNNLLVSGRVGIGTANPEAVLEVNGDVKMFGEWDTTSYVVNQVYQASTDGLVVATFSCDNNNAYHQILVDASSPPTTVRMESCSYGCGKHDTGMVCPVRKGEYWKVVLGADSGTVYWMPLGI